MFVGEYHRLHPTAEVEFLQQAGDVGLGGVFADEQLARDLRDGEPTRDERQDLAFPVGDLTSDVLSATRAGTVNRAMSRRVTDGANSEPPSAAIRMAARS
jgi:hypothetical protein